MITFNPELCNGCPFIGDSANAEFDSSGCPQLEGLLELLRVEGVSSKFTEIKNIVLDWLENEDLACIGPLRRKVTLEQLKVMIEPEDCPRFQQKCPKLQGGTCLLIDEVDQQASNGRCASNPNGDGWVQEPLPQERVIEFIKKYLEGLLPQDCHFDNEIRAGLQDRLNALVSASESE